MDREHTIALLAVSDESAPTNRLLSVLRQAGFEVNISVVSNISGMAQHLGAICDLIVYFAGNTALPLEQVIQHLSEMQSDAPLLYCQPENDAATRSALLQAGVTEVAAVNDSVLLAQLVPRLARGQQCLRENQQLARRVRELEAHVDTLLQHSSEAIAYIADGIHVYCNPAYSTFCQHEGTALQDTPLLDLVAARHHDELRALLAQGSEGTGEYHFALLNPQGEEIPATLHFSPARHDGQDCLQLRLQAASGNEAYARQVADMENRDLLTRLDNKTRFLDRLENAIRRALNEGVYSCLLRVRLNEAADLESALGKSRTNHVLLAISRFLQSAINKPFAAARLDRFEFGLLIHDGNLEEALALADFIKNKINSRITTAPGFELSCSIGLAAINGNALDAGSILTLAASNMHDPVIPAGESFDYHIGDTAQPSSAQIIDYLELALEKDRFKLLFQPIVNIKGEDFKAYEVFTRLQDDAGNDIPPMVFIPAANIHGLGEKFDRIVMSRLLESLSREENQEIALALNITGNTLASRTFLPWLSEQLVHYGVDSQLLIFEISEIELYHNPESTLLFCKGLDELGLRKTLTAFGCALHPFHLLDSLRPDYVTLDYSLTRDLAYSQQQRDNIRNLVRELHSKGYMVAVPNVEDIDILPILWELGVDLAQGFCLQRPSQEMNYEFIQEQEITLDVDP